MRRHHKNADIKKHRGNPHGNAPEYKRPEHESSDENLRQTVRPGVAKIKGKDF